MIALAVTLADNYDRNFSFNLNIEKLHFLLSVGFMAHPW